MVYFLQCRYTNNKIYTSTRPILLALTPFKDIRYIYGEEFIKQYWEKMEQLMNGFQPILNKKVEEEEEMSPHVYGIADNAFRSMIILCSKLQFPSTMFQASK